MRQTTEKFTFMPPEKGGVHDHGDAFRQQFACEFMKAMTSVDAWTAAAQARVEAREADIPGHSEPTWNDVIVREYEPLTLGVAAIRVDVLDGIDAAATQVLAALRRRSVGR